MRSALSTSTALLLAGGAVAGAQLVRADASLPAPGTAVTVPAFAGVAVCPGPQTLLAPDGATPVLAPGPVVIGALALAERVAPLAGLAAMHIGQVGAPPGGTPLIAGTQGASVLSYGLRTAGPRRLDLHAPAAAQSSDAAPGAAPVVAAVQEGLARSGDLRGLSLAACGQATTQAWLVGGATTTGRRLRLLLANPAPAPAVVDVVVHGPDGPVPAAAGTGLVVAPGGERAVYVDALAPGLTALAVQVRARSGRIVASMLDSLVRGLVPGGVDAVGIAGPPAAHVVVAGVAIRAPDGTPASSLPADPQAPGAVAVRVAVPGSQDAVIRVHLVSESGEVDLPGGGVATVPAGGVRDLAVTGVPDGIYAAVVDADTPIVAGAVIGRSVVGSQAAGTPAGAGRAVPPSELAWAAGTAPLRGTMAVALPRLPSPAAQQGAQAMPAKAWLTFAAAGSPGRVMIAQVYDDARVGPPRTLEVGAGSTATLMLDPDAAGARVSVDPEAGGPLMAALLVEVVEPDGRLFSVLPLQPPAQSSAQPGLGANGGAGLGRALEDPALGLTG